MDDGMDELLGEFLVESFENLDQLDQDLVALEADPANLEVLKSIFRTIHTIKGTCGFLGFGTLERITHVGESLLSLLRDGAAAVDTEIADGLLSMTDAVRAILVEIEHTGTEGADAYPALVAELARLQERAESGGEAVLPAAVPAAAPASAEPEPAVIDGPNGGAIFLANLAPRPRPDAVDVPEPGGEPELEPEPGTRVGELLVRDGAAAPVDVAVGLIQQEGGDQRPLGEILVDAGVVTPEVVSDTLEAQREVKSAVADATIRVDVGLVDSLMTLVGELVLARNQILQLVSSTPAAAGEPAFMSATQRLNLITTELQTGVMKTRMQPIGNVWSKFPRVVRDVASQCGKQVRIEMDGKETELDKTIIEAIKDPLTHLVRNSIDHGIELPEVRAERGKPTEGLVLLRAYHEGGQVNIEISDDGAGVDVERVKAKALERGLITPVQAAQMSDRDAVNLIFLPGFSTADQVSNISGRGVGMDVVKTNIEKIGGTLDVQNRPGAGTTLRIKIPLTLAIVPALIVKSAGAQYAIPQVSLLELVGLSEDQARTAIENVQGTPVYRLRGNILPIVRLREELGDEPAPEAGPATIVVLRADEREFGLVVDEVRDTEEIVVKPLSPHVADIAAFSGCTIMGDGRVALILDVLGLAQRAHVIGENRERSGAPGAGVADDTEGPTEALLLVQVGSEGRVAIPLSSVDRLEEFPAGALEKASGRDVVQYRDSILPLIDVCNTLGYTPDYERDASQLPVVVYSAGGRMCGLVVDAILDIVEDRLTPTATPIRYGVAGTAVVRGAVTDLLDLHAVIRAADPDFFDRAVPADATTGSLSHV